MVPLDTHSLRIALNKNKIIPCVSKMEKAKNKPTCLQFVLFICLFG